MHVNQQQINKTLFALTMKGHSWPWKTILRLVDIMAPYCYAQPTTVVDLIPKREATTVQYSVEVIWFQKIICTRNYSNITVICKKCNETTKGDNTTYLFYHLKQKHLVVYFQSSTANMSSKPNRQTTQHIIAESLASCISSRILLSLCN